MSRHLATRARLRAVISDYHNAASLDGEHFEAAAAVLAPALHAPSVSALIAAIDDAIADCTYPDIVELLRNARRRTCGDVTGLARATNDAINARIAHAEHTPPLRHAT